MLWRDVLRSHGDSRLRSVASSTGELSVCKQLLESTHSHPLACTHSKQHVLPGGESFVVQIYRKQAHDAGAKAIPFLTSLRLDIRNIREAFTVVGKMLEESGGVFAFLSPVGKPFIIVSDEAILKDVLIHHASHYGKQHANGILEIFRRTTLPTSGTPAWKPVHKIASRLAGISEHTERDLIALVDALVNDLLAAPGPVDVSKAISDWYWKVTLLLVLGDPATLAPYPASLDHHYRQAWEACIERLSSPIINALSFYKYMPTPANVWYHFAAWRFRRHMTALIRRHDEACAGASPPEEGSAPLLAPSDEFSPVPEAGAHAEPRGQQGRGKGNSSVLQIMQEDPDMCRLSVSTPTPETLNPKP